MTLQVDCVHTLVVHTYIENLNHEVIYIELRGHKSAINMFRKVFKEKAITFPNSSYYTKEDYSHYEVKKLDNSYSSIILYNQNLYADTLFFGHDEEDIHDKFEYWMHNTQVLPHLKGFNEKLNKTFEQHIFQLMVDQGLLIKHERNINCLGYELIDPGLKDANEEMQKVIFDSIRDTNLMTQTTMQDILDKYDKEIEDETILLSIYNENKSIHFIDYNYKQNKIFGLVKTNSAEYWKEFDMKYFSAHEYSVKYSILDQITYINDNNEIKGKENEK